MMAEMISTNVFISQTSPRLRLVMTLRTPRRRISPRTKLRYRAIREFFRRALGSTSQDKIKINSSIAVNVTDLQRKIVGLEQQLNEVNRHCRDIAYLEDCSRVESKENSFQYDFRHEIDTIKELTEGSSEKKSNGLGTQLLYKSSDCNCKKSEDSGHLSKPDFDKKLANSQMALNYDDHVTKEKSKKSKVHHNTKSKLHKHKSKSVYDNMLTAHSTSSFHSLMNNMNDNKIDYPAYSYEKKHLKKENYRDLTSHPTKDKKYKEILKKNTGDQFKVPYEEKSMKFRKNKRSTRDLDPDFIADIIRKQYKPVKLFGRKESDFSQFSAPVCRDQEFSIKENIQEGSELCSCFYPDISRRHRRMKHRDLSGLRSVCDTRLYSSNKQARYKNRRMHVDTYNNSELYDLIPVKERSSPKMRKKIIDANIIPYEYYKEVPPSPRTLRPRLNLQAQYYTELEDFMVHNKHKLKRRFPQNQKSYPDYQEQFEADTGTEFIPETNTARVISPQKFINVNVPIEEKHVQDQSQQETGTMNSLQYAQYINEQTSTAVDMSINKTQDTEINVDKTDKALCEIKDILQNFLQEIKKDNVPSQCDKSDYTYKTQDNDSNIQQDPNTKINNDLQNSASCNNYGTGQCGTTPYISPFATNPCCYPVMPICPINYPMPLQNGGFLMPSQSYTCSNCVTVPNKSVSVHCCNKNTELAGNTETDELIKEIYKFVAQGPIGKQGNDNKNDRDVSQGDAKILTSTSVGESFKNYQHDAKVGTQPLKCYSKSCEAIGSRMVSDTYYSGTNASYSDTLLEKLSLEAGTHSMSETELDMEQTGAKNKGSKFSRMLRSFTLFKKKKKDVIEELSESDSVTEEDHQKSKQPPFRQQVTNYMMHGQEYYGAPPVKSLNEKRPGYGLKPNDYRAHEYQLGPHGHEARAPEYFPQPHEYQSKPHEYQSRGHAYQTRPNEYQHRPYEYQPDYHPPYNPGERGYLSPRLNNPYAEMHPRQQQTLDHPDMRPPHSRQRPTAPPFSSSYDTSYSQMQPPLCLKEIEVKSTGTQSERKMSFFRKFRKKTTQPVVITHMGAPGDQRTFSTQTAVNTLPHVNGPLKTIKPLFNWKSLQEKAKKAIPSPDLDPLAYSYKTQQELAHGNLKMRNAMLKKIFYKRNPFSPRNLIVKTLLGKDKSSFGDPPGVLRPRMFF